MLPFTPLGTRLGFIAPPATFFLILAGMVAVYLAGVEVVTRWFYAGSRRGERATRRRVMIPVG